LDQTIKRTAAALAVGAAAAGSITLSVAGGGLTSPQATQTASTSISANDASRFLTQATFGPTDASISSVQSLGYAGWIDQQEQAPLSPSMVSILQARLVALKALTPPRKLEARHVYDAFWKGAISAPDQLRKRVALALSEIFVISFQAPNMDPLSVGSYYDVLQKDAFGNYRTLLEDVTLHPMMGNYLNILRNKKENLATGQTPDENYAREVQQLMSIGLYKLNQDGTRVTDSSGSPIPTYGQADVQGLAKVFTGFSLYSTVTTGAGSLDYFYGAKFDANAFLYPMVPYPQFHSTSAKSFLGVTIPAAATPDAAGDLKIALDTIFNHPNVGPFIGRQLIQRLVTSNPSPAYVSRVAAVFNNDGTGVRGNLGAVVKAILTDPEARDPTAMTSATFGKLREPVVRMANWARAFKAQSKTGDYVIGDTTTPSALDQSVENSPTVFNFWRPGYSPPNTTLGAQHLVAPEFQTVDAVSVAGYLNVMQGAIDKGIGVNSQQLTPDVRSAYAAELTLINDPGALADRLNLLLLYGQLSSGLRTRITNAVSSIAIPSQTLYPAQYATATQNRVKIAVYLTMASTEYLAQR
jgi:uncharacterized protein (DUF1800 family)